MSIELADTAPSTKRDAVLARRAQSVKRAEATLARGEDVAAMGLAYRHRLAHERALHEAQLVRLRAEISEAEAKLAHFRAVIRREYLAMVAMVEAWESGRILNDDWDANFRSKYRR